MGLDVIRAIQRVSNPVLDVVMEAFTLFGEPMTLAAVFCAIYWCFDKRLGRFLALTLGTSVCLNGIVKDFFKVERMFGQPGIIRRRVETATGYSFPSGHTQAASAFFGGLSISVKSTPLRVVSSVLIVMVGFSRMYLGVHYPTDVLGGIFFGLLSAGTMHYIVVVRDNRKLLVPVCVIIGIIALLTGESDDTIKAAGLLAGILTGLYFEERFASFETKGLSVMKRLVRYALGMAVIGIVYLVPQAFLPSTIIWKCARYALVGFVAMGFCPYLFTKLRQ